ncbi:MAG: SDR family oxidoreductase [Saprospiraceae bacterium]|nr:SDR family oxidoreductase [Saprospiraceae bacterium]
MAKNITTTKWIWITGASSGLGEALAYELAAQGANLVLSARKLEELERVKSNCNQEVQILIQPLDIEMHHTIQDTVKEVLKKIPRINVLINNAGISQRSLVKDTPLDVDKRLMNVNYFGTIELTKAILPSMIAQQSGQIVVISSLVGKIGSPLRSTYAASKHALHGFFDSLRAEVVRDQIHITMICPGYIHTNVSKNALTANGMPQNTTDSRTASGLSPESFAKRAVKAIQKQRQEVSIGQSETLVLYVKRFFPSLVNKILSNVKVT